MTEATTAALHLDQYVDAPPARVWRVLTEPDLLARWWVPGDIVPTVGHRFHLQMPGWGEVACEVLESEPPARLVYTFNADWTLTWELVAEGRGTRVLLEHSGFDLEQHRQRDAYDRMGGGWRGQILPKLAEVAAHTP